MAGDDGTMAAGGRAFGGCRGRSTQGYDCVWNRSTETTGRRDPHSVPAGHVDRSIWCSSRLSARSLVDIAIDKGSARLGGQDADDYPDADQDRAQGPRQPIKPALVPPIKKLAAEPALRVKLEKVREAARKEEGDALKPFRAARARSASESSPDEVEIIDDDDDQLVKGNCSDAAAGLHNLS